MTTALYRRYRPETFADVIGQEHVTEPLMAAIAGQRVSHAYLFSGPRGCGKTTSARILARCLNCAQGPTPTPCGECDSCRELARGGSGSLDVVEIDAASHNGVDDARELRERAVFAPARDRFKIFILDEAHMVTTQGFNALLKLVEEPPDHVKFVFATTEPEKVIGTIRSRTHHYPFRLVPPERLTAYLEQICVAEGVQVGAGVLPLVVRAGGGSVRDSLSVLDQLLAGADGVLDYAQAVALLGYTPATLLDDVVEAFAAADGASVFRVVDRVIGSGHDPRRFVEDLLERLRDLIVIVAAGERADDLLRSEPADQLQRMRGQAEHMGLAQLSRAADLTSAALTEMTGATSPRLQLELLCARLLVPAADEPLRGFGARIERLEQRLAAGGSAAGALPVQAVVPIDHAERPTAAPEQRPTAAPEQRPTAAPGARGSGASARPAGATQRGPAPSGADGRAPSSAVPSGVAAVETETLRRRWPEVLDTLSRLRRATWILVSQNAQVQALTETSLRLRFGTPGIATTFRSGQHAEAVQRALHETLGLDVRVEAVAGDAADTAGSPRSGSSPARSGAADPVARAAADWAAPTGAGGTRGQASARKRAPEAVPGAQRPPGPVRPWGADIPPPPEPEDEPDPSDADLAEGDLVGAPLVERLLGATVIDDIPLGPAGSAPADGS